MEKKILLISILLTLISAQNSLANVISGQVNLTGKLASKAKLEDVIVYFVPDKSPQLKPIKPLSQSLEIKMKNKAYVPRVSVVTSGSTVTIENADSILHNAFSPSRPNQFDLGLYKKSTGKTQVLSQPGVVKVFCNVHYHMVAYVLVLDTPFYARVNSEGRFKIESIDGALRKGKIYVWHERAKRITQVISLPMKKDLEINLPITKRRIPLHKNKSGKSYKKKKRRRRY